MIKRSPLYLKAHGLSYAQAMEKGLIREGPPPTKEEAESIERALLPE